MISFEYRVNVVRGKISRRSRQRQHDPQWMDGVVASNNDRHTTQHSHLCWSFSIQSNPTLHIVYVVRKLGIKCDSIKTRPFILRPKYFFARKYRS